MSSLLVKSGSTNSMNNVRNGAVGVRFRSRGVERERGRRRRGCLSFLFGLGKEFTESAFLGEATPAGGKFQTGNQTSGARNRRIRRFVHHTI
jgi:hypothetical protein